MTSPIYTIGHGNRDFESFLAILQQNQIDYLVDVRSSPYSRYKPEYNREIIAAALGEKGIHYLFLGDVLGGRPSDQSCYTDGKVDYDKMKEKPEYIAGVERLKKAFQQQLRVVLMCSEGKPSQCHRSKLIGASLEALNIPVMHIDPQDELIEQADVIAELTKGQLALFGEESFTSRKRYVASKSDHDNEDYT